MERAPEPAASPPKEKGRFSGFQPKPQAREAAPVRNIGQESMDGVLDYARAYADAERMGALGLPVLAHQTRALEEAAHTVFSRTPGACRLQGRAGRPGARVRGHSA